jgi:hypothetical protein
LTLAYWIVVGARAFCFSCQSSAIASINRNTRVELAQEVNESQGDGLDQLQSGGVEPGSEGDP